MTNVDTAGAEYSRDNRLRAIASNAIREAMIAYGRGDKPFLDDDARRMDVIFNLLHVSEVAMPEMPQYEHYPLAAPVQADHNPALQQVANILEQLPADFEAKFEKAINADGKAIRPTLKK